MKRKKDWRKYLSKFEAGDLADAERMRDNADKNSKAARERIRKIMLRCWARMNRDKKHA